MNEDLRSLNDNTKEYRAKREKLRDQLLERSLEYILTSDRDFRASNVAKVMTNLATEEDKSFKANIKPSAISKNTKLKRRIEVFQNQNSIVPKKLQDGVMTEGDLAFELHKCKTKLAEKIDENKMLQQIINEENLSKTPDNLIVKKSEFDYKFLSKKLCEYMLKDGLMYVHNGSAYLETESHVEFLDSYLVEQLGLGNA